MLCNKMAKLESLMIDLFGEEVVDTVSHAEWVHDMLNEPVMIDDDITLGWLRCYGRVPLVSGTESAEAYWRLHRAGKVRIWGSEQPWVEAR